MRKPTLTIDARAYQSTLSRTFSGNQKPRIPSPVPTPRRHPSDHMAFEPPTSFIGDVQHALKRAIAPNATGPAQAALQKPAGGKLKTSSKWAARFKLPSAKAKAAPELARKNGDQ